MVHCRARFAAVCAALSPNLPASTGLRWCSPPATLARAHPVPVSVLTYAVPSACALAAVPEPSALSRLVSDSHAATMPDFVLPTRRFRARDTGGPTHTRSPV